MKFCSVVLRASDRNNIMGGCTTTSETNQRYSWYSPPLLRLMKMVTPSICSMDWPMAAFISSSVIKQIKIWFQRSPFFSSPHTLLLPLTAPFFSLCSIKVQSFKGPWDNPSSPSSSWNTGLDHVTCLSWWPSLPKKKWWFPGDRALHKKLVKKSAHMRSDKNWETQFLARFYFGYFSTEMTADRSTWETSCICLPFIETRVIRAERVPISDIPRLWSGVKTKRHLIDYLSGKYLLSGSD